MAYVRRADLSPEQLERLRAYERKRSKSKGRGYGKGCCKRCAGLPHRVPAGMRCLTCGLAHQAEGVRS